MFSKKVLTLHSVSQSLPKPATHVFFLPLLFKPFLIVRLRSQLSVYHSHRPLFVKLPLQVYSLLLLEVNLFSSNVSSHTVYELSLRISLAQLSLDSKVAFQRPRGLKSQNCKEPELEAFPHRAPQHLAGYDVPLSFITAFPCALESCTHA